MKIKLMLEELTTKPVKFTIKDDSDKFESEFKVGDIEYEFLGIKRLLKKINKKTKLEYWNIGFYVKEEKDLEKSIGITNSGSANVVFSTIIDIMKKFINSHNPEAILFSSRANRGRMALYNRFIKNASKFFPKYNGYEIGKINNYETAFAFLKKDIPEEDLNIFKVKFKPHK